MRQKIMLGNNNKIYVWRKADERLQPECLVVRGDRGTTCIVLEMHYLLYGVEH